jgi:hypothetical protein
MLFRTQKLKCASELNHTTTTRFQFEPILANFRASASELTNLAFTSHCSNGVEDLLWMGGESYDTLNTLERTQLTKVGHAGGQYLHLAADGLR